MGKLKILAVIIGLFAAFSSMALAGAGDAPAPEKSDAVVQFLPEVFPESETKTIDFSVSISPEMLPADGKTAALVRAKVTDKSGAPLQKREIAFYLESGYGRLTPHSPLTDQSGYAEAEYVAGHVAATAVVRITDQATGEFTRIEIPTSISASISLELVSPARFISSFIKRQTATQLYTMEIDVFPDKLVADGFSTSRITVTLFTLDGMPAGGIPLLMRKVSGGGELLIEKTTTDASGNLEFFYKSGDQPGTTIIEVMEPVTGLAKILEIPVLEAGPAKIKLFFSDKEGKLYEEAAKLPADGVATITVIAQVLNLVEMPVPDVSVQFSLSEELGVLETAVAKADAEGKVYATFKAGTQTGMETITAFLVSKPAESIFAH